MVRHSTSGSGRRDGEAGISLVELMVAFLVLSTVTAALLPLLNRSITLSSTNRLRVTAANLAEQQLEYLRRSKLQEPPLGRTTRPVKVGAVEYSVVQDVRWISKAATAGSCDGGAGGSSTLAYLRVDVLVSWPGMTVRPVESNTVIRPTEVPAAAPGTIAVKVLTKAGSGSPGHTVTLSAPDGSTKSQISDSAGCAFFAYLDYNTAYVASLATAGYVDTSGNPNPSQSFILGPTTPSPASWTVTYDRK